MRLVEDFVVAGASGSLAAIFTNPFDVIKTRMQLQGELQMRGQHKVHYRGSYRAMYMVVKHEGIMALQRALLPMFWIQFIIIGLRLGVYKNAETKRLMQDSQGGKSFGKRLLWSGMLGVVGHIITNPLYIVKTKKMARSNKNIAVGYQHVDMPTLYMVRKIVRTRGVKGLGKGLSGAIPKAFTSATSQMMGYTYSKEYMETSPFFEEKWILKSLCAGKVGGICASICAAPFDLVKVRLYNQPMDVHGRPLIYRGFFDCVRKISQKEGFQAFFKGFSPLYMRLGPHTVMIFFFWDILKEYTKPK